MNAAETAVEDCTCRRRHEHGQRPTYVAHRCRCADCTTANRLYNRQRERLHLYGRWTHRVDATPVRAHLQTLSAAGIGRRRVAELADVAISTVTHITSGRGVTVHRDIADRLLAVPTTADAYGGNAIVPGRGAARRVQALACLGWSNGRIADRIGMPRQNFTHVVQGGPITARTHRAIAAVYDELCLRPAPERNHSERQVASRARNAAQRNGWVPPLAWDDIDRDDQPATADTDPVIDEIAVELIMRGDHVEHPHRADRTEAVRRLHAAGLSVTDIAVRVRVSGSTARAMIAALDDEPLAAAS